jgi:hypothetical protein
MQAAAGIGSSRATSSIVMKLQTRAGAEKEEGAFEEG